MREIQKWGIALLAILPDSLWQLNHSNFGGFNKNSLFYARYSLSYTRKLFFRF